MIDKDLSKGILAIWHDESYWNFIINKLMLEEKLVDLSDVRINLKTKN